MSIYRVKNSNILCYSDLRAVKTGTRPSRVYDSRLPGDLVEPTGEGFLSLSDRATADQPNFSGAVRALWIVQFTGPK